MPGKTRMGFAIHLEKQNSSLSRTDLGFCPDTAVLVSGKALAAVFSDITGLYTGG